MEGQWGQIQQADNSKGSSIRPVYWLQWVLWGLGWWVIMIIFVLIKIICFPSIPITTFHASPFDTCPLPPSFCWLSCSRSPFLPSHHCLPLQVVPLWCFQLHPIILFYHIIPLLLPHGCPTPPYHLPPAATPPIYCLHQLSTCSKSTNFLPRSMTLSLLATDLTLCWYSPHFPPCCCHSFPPPWMTINTTLPHCCHPICW